MITLTDDEVALLNPPLHFIAKISNADEVTLIRSLLTALRGIKVRDIDKALVILAKASRGEKS